ncbi:MAG: hypothetical protein RXR02_07980 [Thermoproteus sp.]
MQNKTKMSWVEERRYMNAKPQEGGVKFIDIDVKIDDVHVNGVARHGKYVVVRYVRRNALTYVFYEPHDAVDKNTLTDAELKHLIMLDYENEVKKERINELREFADKLEEQLRELPVEIVVTMSSHKSHGHVEVKLARQVDKDVFQRYVSICKGLNMKFDNASRVWVYVPQWSQYVTVTYCGSRGC